LRFSQFSPRTCFPSFSFENAENVSFYDRFVGF
jgi:hypothetical protein